eukprot:870640-Rhodomonas_salina.3
MVLAAYGVHADPTEPQVPSEVNNIKPLSQYNVHHRRGSFWLISACILLRYAPRLLLCDVRYPVC